MRNGTGSDTAAEEAGCAHHITLCWLLLPQW